MASLDNHPRPPWNNSIQQHGDLHDVGKKGGDGWGDQSRPPMMHEHLRGEK